MSYLCVWCVWILSTNLWHQVMARLHSRGVPSPLSGKQNSFAIKSAFRRSAGHPSLPAANPFTPAARPWCSLLCTQPQPRWISAKASQHWVFIGRTVQPHNVLGNTISWWSNSGKHLEKNKRLKIQWAYDHLVSNLFLNLLFFFLFCITEGQEGFLNIYQTKSPPVFLSFENNSGPI